MIDLKRQPHAGGGAFFGSIGRQIALYFTGHTGWFNREQIL
jgi:hypothetical protein